jgi:hypothetical protein
MTEANPYKQAVALVVERTGLRPLPAEAVDQLARELWETLHYLSTACAHQLFDDQGETRAPCRSQCKWCGRSCKGPDHPLPDGEQPHPVDQARDIARELLAAIWGPAVSGGVLSPDLYQRIRHDSDLFWLRGEEQPPGQWTPLEEKPWTDMQDFQDRGDLARTLLGIDGTMGDAQDVPHPFIIGDERGSCLICGLSEQYRKHTEDLELRPFLERHEQMVRQKIAEEIEHEASGTDRSTEYGLGLGNGLDQVVARIRGDSDE